MLARLAKTLFAETEVVNQCVRSFRLGSNRREHYKRSVAVSFDLNHNVSLVNAHVESIAEGGKAIYGFKEAVDLAMREHLASETAVRLHLKSRQSK